jgi:hypothetical protein
MLPHLIASGKASTVARVTIVLDVDSVARACSETIRNVLKEMSSSSVKRRRFFATSKAAHLKLATQAVTVQLRSDQLQSSNCLYKTIYPTMK